MAIEHIGPLNNAQRVSLRDEYLRRMRAVSEQYDKSNSTPEIIQAMNDMNDFVDKMNEELKSSEHETERHIENPDSHDQLPDDVKNGIEKAFRRLDTVDPNS